MTLDTKEGVKDYFRQLEEWTASDRVDETEDLAKINEHMDWALNEKERQIRALYRILKDKGEEMKRLRKEIEKAEWEREQMRVSRDAERSKAEMVVARDRVRIVTLEKQKKVIRRALRIAARMMTQSGIMQFREWKTGTPIIKTEKESIAWIERHLLNKARKEIEE